MKPADDPQPAGPEPGESITPPPGARAVFGARLPLAVAYHRSLAGPGSERGFLGPRELPRLWERHILNSVAIASLIPHGARVVDVGSGAGLPGVPLAIARPDLDITLLEPLLKRSVYLGEVADQLEAGNLTVLRGRAEEKSVIAAVGGADAVVSRAVAPLGKLTRWCLPLLRCGGCMLAMKGDSAGEEIERDARVIRAAGGGEPELLRVGSKEKAGEVTVVRVMRRR